MKPNSKLKRTNARSRLLTKLGYEVWEIDELTVTAATYAFDDENEKSSIKEVRESIDEYKSIIIGKALG